MSIVPIITFKAGLCRVEGSSRLYITPQPEKGYIYLYIEDDLIKFCWRRRSLPLDQPEVELLMPPNDGTFVAYEPAGTRTGGRIWVLRFESSSERQFFWMQSKPQRASDPSWFSPRDRKIGEIVDRLLQGEEVDVQHELRQLSSPERDDDDDDNRNDRDEDGDETMEDADQLGRSGGAGAGGAGADATGGDVRHEGENSREGGADGARAATTSSSSDNLDAAAAVRSFLNSIKDSSSLSRSAAQRRGLAADRPYPHLTHLLAPATTVPVVEAMAEEHVDRLMELIPATVVVLAAAEAAGDLVEVGRDLPTDEAEPSPEAARAARAALSLTEKRALLGRVLHSPQFQQSLAALTQALRDGGLPDVAGALGIKLEHGGRLPGGMPLGGGKAVEAFVEGVRRAVEEEAGKEEE